MKSATILAMNSPPRTLGATLVHRCRQRGRASGEGRPSWFMSQCAASELFGAPLLSMESLVPCHRNAQFGDPRGAGRAVPQPARDAPHHDQRAELSKLRLRANVNRSKTRGNSYENCD